MSVSASAFNNFVRSNNSSRSNTCISSRPNLNGVDQTYRTEKTDCIKFEQSRYQNDKTRSTMGKRRQGTQQLTFVCIVCLCALKCFRNLFIYFAKWTRKTLDGKNISR